MLSFLEVKLNMQIPIYHINAFTSQLFSGNPAAVCFLPQWISTEKLQAIANENNMPVTTFLVGDEEGYLIRWFTSESELDLCGHGSLAAAHIIFQEIEPAINEIVFISPKAGRIQVKRKHKLIFLDFPVKEISPVNEVINLNIQPKEIYQHKSDYLMLIIDSEAELLNLQLNMQLLEHVLHRGIVITAPGKQVDFVSRTFYPKKRLWKEDAVTGTSHCILVPYWAKTLGKNILKARQVSQRGGELQCELTGNRVLIGSQAITYSQGMISLTN